MFRPIQIERNVCLNFSLSFANQYAIVPDGKHICISFWEPPTGDQLKQAIIAFPKNFNKFTLCCDYNLTAEEYGAALASTPTHVKYIKLYLTKSIATTHLDSILAKIPEHVDALYLAPKNPLCSLITEFKTGMSGIPPSIKTLGFSCAFRGWSEDSLISLFSCIPKSITTLDLSDNSFDFNKDIKEKNEEAWCNRFDKLPEEIEELIIHNPYDPKSSPFSFYHEIRQARRMRAAELVAESIPTASLDVLSIVMQYATSPHAIFWKKQDGKSLVASTASKEENPALMNCIVR